MRFSTASVFLATFLIGSSVFAAKPKPLKPAIFAAKLTCYDISLTAADGSGNVIYYTGVTETITRAGKVRGSAMRYDTVSQVTAPVTISGGIKGKIKLVKKNGKTFAAAKAVINFSDGTTGNVNFTTRNLPKTTKSAPTLADSDLTDIFGFLTALLNAVAYSGQTFSYKAK